jgi:WD40 repeat protein
LIKKVSLLSTARAVAWSYDGTQIAVGLGGSATKGRQKLDGAVRHMFFVLMRSIVICSSYAICSGSANHTSSPFFLQIQFVILNAETLEIIFEGRDSRQYISEMKFSGDGNTLAIGSRDTKIYLYDTKNFGLRAKCEKHNSYITHFDFAMDSNFLQSNCGAFELLFCELLDFISHFLRVLAL